MSSVATTLHIQFKHRVPQGGAWCPAVDGAEFHKAALVAADLHTQYEFDGASQGNAWSHKVASTATHYHMQSTLGVLLGGVWCPVR